MVMGEAPVLLWRISCPYTTVVSPPKACRMQRRFGTCPHNICEVQLRDNRRQLARLQEVGTSQNMVS